MSGLDLPTVITMLIFHDSRFLKETMLFTYSHAYVISPVEIY